MKHSLLARATVTVVALAMATVLQAAEPLQGPAVEAALKAAYEKYQGLEEGKNADYIPALAKVDPKIFGIALVTADGNENLTAALPRTPDALEAWMASVR